MLASKSPTTTVLPLIAIEMRNQSFVARVEGVSSASCTRFMGGVAALRSVPLRIDAENKIIVENKRNLGMDGTPWESGLRALTEPGRIIRLAGPRCSVCLGRYAELSQAILTLDLIFCKSSHAGERAAAVSDSDC